MCILLVWLVIFQLPSCNGPSQLYQLIWDMLLSHNHFLKHQKNSANCNWSPFQIPLVCSTYLALSTEVQLHFSWTSSSTRSSQANWLRLNMWMICLPSSANRETISKGSYIELSIKASHILCRAYPRSLHQNPTYFFLYSNEYQESFLLARFPVLVPDFEDPTFSHLQGWIPEHLCYWSQTL